MPWMLMARSDVEDDLEIVVEVGEWDGMPLLGAVRGRQEAAG